MKKTKERRRKKRWQVAVLVRCSLPKYGDRVFEMEMWAKDVNEKGMKLEWTKGLNVTQVHTGSRRAETHNIRFDDLDFKKGEVIKIQDLFYDDDGSPFMEGKILWARKTSSSESWNLGIQFDDQKKQSTAVVGAFKDFLGVVKNPTLAISRASRKK